MSAIEWLLFISPYIWPLVLLNLLALVPTKVNQSQSKRVKFTLILFSIVFVGWCFAHLALHIMHYPNVRGNVLDASKVLLTPALIALGILIPIRLFQRDNLLSWLLIFICQRILKPIVNALIESRSTISAFILAFLKAYTNSANKETMDEKIKASNERAARERMRINWDGNYYGDDDWNSWNQN